MLNMVKFWIQIGKPHQFWLEKSDPKFQAKKWPTSFPEAATKLQSYRAMSCEADAGIGEWYLLKS